MSTGIWLVLKSEYCDACARVYAIRSAKYGYIISKSQLLSAKRRMNVPLWSIVVLLPSEACTALRVLSSSPDDDDEVIQCIA